MRKLIVTTLAAALALPVYARLALADQRGPPPTTAVRSHNPGRDAPAPAAARLTQTPVDLVRRRVRAARPAVRVQVPETPA